MIDVSIIIPNFNNKEFIKEAVGSALGQTHRNIEVIVVDDCSSDDSLAELSVYAEDKRLRILRNEKNLGVSATRNRGIRESKGSYIAFLDSDDLYHNEKIQNEFELIRDKDDCFTYSNIQIVSRTGETLRVQDLTSTYSFWQNLFRIKQVPRDMLVPRSVIVEEGIFFDESLSLYEDWKWKLQITRRLRGLKAPGLGTSYRKLSDGLSSKPKALHIRSQIKIFWQSVEDRNFIMRSILLLLFTARLGLAFARSLIR